MKILAYVEQRNGELKKNAFEVVTAARSIAEATGGSVSALIVGNGVDSLAGNLAPYGVNDVVVVNEPRLADYSYGAVARAIAEVAKQEGSDLVVMSHSAHGKDLGPTVAIRLDAGFVPDAISFSNDNGKLVFTRPVYAGKGRADVALDTERGVVSVRPNVFTAKQADAAGSATPRSASVTFQDRDFATKVVETSVSSGKKDVADADIIVSGGRGLKGPEHFNIVEDLASALDAAVGASRAVVDAGWRPHAEQVGQTGKTVSPTLYVACAISGAVQHLAGMSSSRYILAINKDREAPIFGIADYGIVGDVFEVLPLLTEEIRAAKN